MSVKTPYIQSIDSYFHVYNRGASRGTIFFDDRNYEYFISRMKSALDQKKLEVIAYCLMPNHYHLILLQNQSNSIPTFIRTVCEGYSKAINKERSRTGHLFEGRYRIKPVLSDEYLLHLSRYIHRNPLRARLTVKSEEWPYSSYRDYLTKE